ncbi:MAG TPA: MurR/RpiR family transcriptional regulator [Rectinemataceae bacterium]|nr:MurR/RpiR family transcriptional regulator [Rectinemataceae bacterium]
MAEIDLRSLVSNAKLTRKEIVVADYLLDNGNTACFMSAAELARKLDTSSTTINRTAKALGYDSFNELQKEIQDSVSRQVIFAQSILVSPLERLSHHLSENHSEKFMSDFSELIADNIKSAFQKNNSEALDLAIDILIKSKTKFISGQRPTVFLAERFSYLMRIMLPGVIAVTDNNYYEKILDIGKDDCFFIIDFNQYSKNALQQLEYAKTTGTKIILLTDKSTAPLARFADVLLVVDVFNLSFFNCGLAPLFLLEFLCLRIAARMNDTVKERLKLLTPYFESHHLAH